MWIKRKPDDEVINLNKVIAIKKYVDETEHEFQLHFETDKQSYYYIFENEKEVEEYYAYLIKLIGAREVPLLKI